MGQGAGLPAAQELFPVLVFSTGQVPAEYISRSRAGFPWGLQKVHSGLSCSAPTFFQIAFLAGSDEVGPAVSAAQPSWQHMVDREDSLVGAAVLAAVLVTAEYLTF